MPRFFRNEKITVLEMTLNVNDPQLFMLIYIIEFL